MYTERSVNLKSDFYKRYGEASGRLYFEKTGLPCVVLDGGENKMMFSLNCGVRAYGRAYGDVLRVLNADTNVCDVHFVKNGKGAQILYKTDIADLQGVRNTAIYTINNLLYKMGSTGRIENDTSLESICDRYAPFGWCGVKLNGNFYSVPLPLFDYNVLLIQPRKTRITSKSEMLDRFRCSENDRINGAYMALKSYKIDTFFEILNESEKSAEMLLALSDEIVCAVHATYGIEGIAATRVCEYGIISFCGKEKTDNAILRIQNECKRNLGYSVRIAVVK